MVTLMTNINDKHPLKLIGKKQVGLCGLLCAKADPVTGWCMSRGFGSQMLRLDVSFPGHP